MRRRLWQSLLSLAALLCLIACTAQPILSPQTMHFVTAPGADARELESPDGLQIFGQWWRPAEKPRGVILLIHGTALHSGFYAPWAERAVANGYAVFAFDLRGWGQSQGYGRRGFVGNYDEYVEDVELAAREVRRVYPQAPLFLQGESMGGTVVLMVQMMNRVPVAGLILNAPAVKPNPGLGMVRIPGAITGLGLWGVSQAARLSPDSPALPVWDASVSLVMFDPATQKRFIDDPLCTHTALPAAYIAALQDGSERVQMNLGNLTAPLLVLQGDKDILVPLDSSQFLMEKAGSLDKTLRVYEGMSHATLHDTDREKVWNDILGWLDMHTPQRW